MPPKKNPKIQLPDVSSFLKLEFNTNVVDNVIYESGYCDDVRDLFSKLNKLNTDIKEVHKSIDRKVPSTPKKAVAAYQKILDEIEDLQKLNILDESVAIPSPKKQTTPLPVSNHNVTPKKSKEKPYVFNTPPRQLIPGTPRSNAKFSSSKTLKTNFSKSVVPKATNVKRANPSEIFKKSKHELEEAERRRIEIMQDKTERTRREREERERKVRQKRLEEEEARRKAIEQRKERDQKLKEMEKINAEEHKTEKLKLPTTPKVSKQVEAKATPRQAAVPMKKAKDGVIPVIEVNSPVLKHKPIKNIKKKETKVQPVISQKSEAVENNEKMEVENKDVKENDVFVIVSQEEAAELEKKKNSVLRRSFNVNKKNDSLDMFTITENNTIKTLNAEIKKDANKPPQIIAEDSSVLKEMNICKPSALPPINISKNICEETVVIDNAEENVNPKDTTQTNYDMTADKVFIPSTEDNYVVDDLSSNDETDDENNPRKIVPKWARKENLNPMVKEMLKESTLENRSKFFGIPPQPCLELLFPEANIRSNRRHNSSSVWNSPLPNPWT